MDNGFDFFGFSFESVVGGFIAIMIFAGIFNFFKSIFETIYYKFFWNEDKYYESKESITYSDSIVENSKKESVEEIQQKIEELNEEEKLKDLREQLNQKRIERGLLSLFEFEELENKINDFKATYERKKRSRNYAEEKYSYLKPRRNIGTVIFFVPAVYSFYSISDSGVPAIIAGSIFWIIGISYFYYLNKKIRFFKNKTEILSSEIKDLEIEIDKNSHILDKNKL